MVTSQKFYAKSISQTSESTVWNSTNPKNPRKYRKFINLDALKADDSNYATCSNLGGKNYEVVRFYPMPGFNWRATITYQF